MNDLQHEPDMLEIHDEAMQDIDTAVHDLLLGYTQGKLIYVFVEGRGDVSFYKQVIAAKLKNGWGVKIYSSGNRKKVFSSREDVTVHDLDVSRFAFIVDRDFHSIFSNETLPEEFYITDGYSLENYLCSGELLVGILEAYYGLTNITHAEAEAIIEHFDQANSRFCGFVAPLTYQMASWRAKGSAVQFSTIKPKSFSPIQVNEQLVSGEMPSDTLVALCDALNADQCSAAEISSIQSHILGKYDLRDITRGKFVAWFFCRYLEVFPGIFEKVIGAEKKLPRATATIGANNFTALCGTHAGMPETLWRFLNVRFPKFSVAIDEEIAA